MFYHKAALCFGLIASLLVENCWSKHVEVGGDGTLTAEARAGLFGNFFNNLALDTETSKLTPLLYKSWKEKCDMQLQGLTLTPIGNNLYYIYDKAPVDGTFANWQQAKTFCTQRGMDLASLETSQEYNAFVNYMTRLLGPVSTTGALEGYWIGLNALATQGSYVWPTIGTSPNYPFAWGTDEPDVITADFCVSIQKTDASAIRFFAEDCEAAFSKFVCEVQSPCREVLLLRYYIAKKFNVINDSQYQLQLFNLFQNKNFNDILFNNNANTITG